MTAPETDDRPAADVEAPEPAPVGDLDKRSWIFALKSALGNFTRHGGTDMAASLTYYAVLSLFPALLAMVSLLGVFGQGETTTQTLLDMISDLGQEDAAEQLRGPINDITTSTGAGLTLVVGVLGALWSASGYVGGFGRAMNRIYDIEEGRPIWKLRPAMLLLTAVLVVMAGLVLVSAAVSGGIARTIGDTIGLGEGAVTVWGYAKWPVMLLVVVIMIALLYYFTPNVRQEKIRWLSPGAAFALVVAILASVGFGFYVSNFGSYNQTYGSLAGVIVFLLWLWIINNVLLLGAELDAEILRARQLNAGIAAEETVQLPPRDTAQSEKAEEKREESLEEARLIRVDAERENAAARREAAAGAEPVDGDARD